MSIQSQMTELFGDSALPPLPEAPPASSRPAGEIELGWSGVATGLTRILIGYSLLQLQIIMVVLLVTWLVSEMPATVEDAGRAGLTMALVATLGFGLIALVSLYSYILILTGKCRCAIDAPEASGARWLMFACILCIIAGPVLSIASSFVGPSQARDLSSAKSREELTGKLAGPSHAEAVGGILSIGATLLFVLFLRAIGQRFESQTLVTMCEVYLLVSALVVGVTLQLFYFSDNPFQNLLLLAGVAVGWLLLGVLYIGLIIGARVVLAVELSRPRSPLSS